MQPGVFADRITMRLGGMHLTMAFIASIGKLFSDGGLYNLPTDSNVYATATVTQMLQGKQYSHGIRLIYEVMAHLFLRSAEAFANEHHLPWFDEEILRLVKEMEDSFKLKDRAACAVVHQEAESRISSDVLETIQTLSATFFYWNTFLDTGDILLRLIRAAREADLSMHLNAVMDTIPYFFLAG
jgi:hypothetical protein